MKSKTKVIFVSVLIFLSVIYISFNYYYISKNRFEFIGQESILYVNEIYGFWNEEKLGNSELRFRWMNDLHALKRVKIRGNKISIPIFCLKPDIAEEPIEVKIFSGGRMIGDFVIEDSQVKYLEGDIAGMGYEVGEYLDIRFEVDSLWTPADYGIGSDTRDLGIAVGNIEFKDE
ncbi:MAG: hypothetical protein MUP02_09965 [Actinobacteria bacterium]|nr:hypothetical protein [Actinomycetota bacterium]